MSANQIPIEAIAKLADDVRLIKDFAENHNFNSGLLSASIAPKRKYDTPLLAMIGCMLIVVALVAVVKFWNPPLSTSANNFIFLIGLIFATIASMTAHMRFQDKVVTSIVAVGLLMVLFIGAGIVTPQEALNKVGELAK